MTRANFHQLWDAAIMKICYFADSESIHVKRMVNYFKSEGYDLFVITRNLCEDLDVRQYRIKVGIPVLKHYRWSLFRNAFSPLLIRHIRKLIERERPDIIHAYYTTSNGFIAALTNFHPLIVSVIGSDIFVDPKSKILKWLVKYALKKADIIHCLFPLSLAEPVFSELGSDISKARTILFGVDTSEYQPMKYNLELAEELGISPSSPIVIYTRGFAPVYDYETFFKAIPMILSEVPETKFLALHKRGQRELGENLVQQMGITDSVTFMEWVPRERIPQLFSLASVYVSTSISDGASNSLFEAMACKLAPVVTNIPGNRPWVNDGINGFLFPVSDSESLASHVLHLLKNTTLRSQFGERCRQIVQEKAEQSNEMGKYENLYRELAGKHSAPKEKR